MCAAMVDRNPEYPDYGRPMYDSNPQNDYGRPAYESYQQPGDYRRGQEYGQERYNPTSQYPGSSDPPVVRSQASLCSCIILTLIIGFFSCSLPIFLWGETSLSRISLSMTEEKDEYMY